MDWLVVRGGALGDFLLTLPALERARAQARRLTLVATPRYARLRPDLYDDLLDLRGPEALWLFGAGEPPALPGTALVYTPGVAETLRDLGVHRVLSAAPRPAPGVHAIEHLLSPLGEAVSAGIPRIATRPWTGPLPGPRPVVLAPGAASPDKVWGGFAPVAAALEATGCPFVWAPGRDEPWTGRAGVVLPDLDLPALASLADACGAWLGNDTGTTHLAAAAGASVLAMFGPTDPACWAPRPGRVAPFGSDPENIAHTLMITRGETLAHRLMHTTAPIS